MNQKVLNILKVVAFFLLVVDLEAQEVEKIRLLSDKKQQINRKGMVILTSWASVNVLSGVGYFVSGDYKEQCFYGMNGAWGIVNLSIALPALLTESKQPDSMKKLIDNQKKTEKIFLINSALDVVYVAGGITLYHWSNLQKNDQQKLMFSGFGNSIIMQGAALLIFDTSMFLANRKFRKKELNDSRNLQISFAPNQIQINYRF